MYALLALLPVAVIIVGLVLFRHHMRSVALAALGVATALAWQVWQIEPSTFNGSVIKGILTMVDISVVIFGALVFLEVIRAERVLSSIEHYLHSLSSDSRIQVILLAWFFGAFLEGSAGFGIPALITAPLLVNVGLKPVLAVTIALLANCVPVTFGAVGTPILVGLSSYPALPIAQQTIFIGGLLGLFVPTLLLAALTLGLRQSWEEYFRGGLPFALWSGAAFVIPYYFALQIGPEFPSLIGAIVGIVLAIIPLKFGLFIPPVLHRAKTYEPNENPLHIWRTLFPYIVLVVLLIGGKYVLPQFTLSLPGDLVHQIRLFNPGIIFLVVAALYILRYRMPRSEVSRFANDGLLRLGRPAMIIFCTATIMQVMANSGVNTSGLSSMVEYGFERMQTIWLPVYAPLVGALGGFVAGSTTLSNVIFGTIQGYSAQVVGYSAVSILALQVVGATGGNMMSLTNVIAAVSTVDAKREEGHIMLKLIPWVALYLGAAIVIGLAVTGILPE